MEPLTEQQKKEIVLSVLAYVDVEHAKKAVQWIEEISKGNPLSDQQEFAKECFEQYINL